MLRLTATTALAALMLAACTPAAPTPDDGAPKPEAEAAIGIEAVAPEEAAPVEIPDRAALAYANKSENYEVSFEIDPAILDFDEALAAKIWREAKAELAGFESMADSDRKSADQDAAASGNESWFRTYSLDITYRVTAVQGDIISIQHTVSHYTGGAHPNYALGGGIYQRGQTAPLPLAAFITDVPAFETQVISAIVDEKLARGYEETRPVLATSVSEMLAPSTEQPAVFEGRFVLDDSTEAGKFGGMTVLFSPYDVGAYAEGAYVVTLPAAGLAPILTSDWAGKFGGSPVVESEAP
jgi:hypothetical protein